MAICNSIRVDTGCCFFSVSYTPTVKVWWLTCTYTLPHPSEHQTGWKIYFYFVLQEPVITLPERKALETYSRTEYVIPHQYMLYNYVCMCVCVCVCVCMYVSLCMCVYVRGTQCTHYFSKATIGVQLKAQPACRACTFWMYISRFFLIVGLSTVERTTLYQYSDPWRHPFCSLRSRSVRC